MQSALHLGRLIRCVNRRFPISNSSLRSRLLHDHRRGLKLLSNDPSMGLSQLLSRPYSRLRSTPIIRL